MSCMYVVFAYVKDTNKGEYMLFRFDTLRELVESLDDIKNAGCYDSVGIYKKFSLRK